MAKLANPLGSVSVLAAVNLSKHIFVGFDGNVCAANAKAVGVSEVDTAGGEMAGVIFSGVALVKTGGAITAGAAVVSDSSGRAAAASALTFTIPAGSTNVTSSSAQPALTKTGSVLSQAINGYAMDAASGTDEIIRVLLV
jgi:hypothetical protein